MQWYSAWHQRTKALSWPLGTMKEHVMATRDKKLIKAAAANTNYPLRAIRYWWTYCTIVDEIHRQKKPLTILDAGCGDCISRSFVGELPDTRWIGIDWNMNEELLLSRGYDAAYQCDLDQPIALADGCADIIVVLHVLEHLPRISFTLHELSRLLRPGGVLLTGSPISPWYLSWVRELRYKYQQRSKGSHINAFHPGRWHKLLGEAGLTTEASSGSHFFLWSGNPLENYAWWLRVNLMWGAAFPSWGRDLYILARKETETHQ